jgi:hypothetical protein
MNYADTGLLQYSSNRAHGTKVGYNRETECTILLICIAEAGEIR